MLPELAIAIFLGTCLAVFSIANLYNLTRFGAGKRRASSKAELERPTGLIFMFAALGTLVFFSESALYILLVFLNHSTVITHPWLQLRFPFDYFVQIIGILVSGFGYALFIWSVQSRGRYATSWAMPKDQKLVTWGPYQHVRHPSYLAYFILFTGLFLTLLNLVTIIPFMAIPGYVLVASKEEEMLTSWFGSEYVEYQRKTGMFLPKMKRQADSIR